MNGHTHPTAAPHFLDLRPRPLPARIPHTCTRKRIVTTPSVPTRSCTFWLNESMLKRL